MFPMATVYFRHFVFLCNRDYGTYSIMNSELNNQMSEQILITLTLFSTHL